MAITKNDIWLVIPVKNEESRIKPVIELSKIHIKNIIVVNDGSTDNTLDILNSIEGIHIINNPVNEGKAKALLIGCDKAKELGAKAIIMMDGDGQHDANKLPSFINSLESNDYDLVLGSRSQVDPMPIIRRIFNTVISLLLSTLFNIKISDTLNGFKGFTIELYNKIRWAESIGYNIETDLLINASKYKPKYIEILIPTNYNNKYTGATKIDGLKILWNVIKRKING